MALPPEFLSELKYRNDIESVVGSYVNLRRRGSNLVGLCPFHNEKTPSFTLYPENGSYYCFGCGAGGDVITFIRAIENLDYMEAVRFLADRAGMQVPEQGYDDSAARIRAQILEMNRAAAHFFHEMLLSPQGAAAREYLAARQLSPATIRHFGLGYAPDDWTGLTRYLEGKGFPADVIVLADLAGKSKNGRVYDRFRNKIMLPIIDLRGGVIAFGGRKMPNDEGTKYINSSDTPVYKKSRNVYALNFAKNVKGDSLILAEGYMDVISLHQAGFENAVAALGTSFTSEQAHLLSRYAKEIVVTLDADAAGQRATARAIEILNEAGVRVRVLRIPDGKDPDEFIKAHGAEKFRLLLEDAGNDIEYKLLCAREGFDLSAESGRMLYLQKAVEILAGVDDAIARELYAGRLGQEFGVSKDAVVNQLRQKRSRSQARQSKQQLRQIVAPGKKRDEVNPERARYPRAARAEECLLTLLMYHPDLARQSEEKLPPDHFLTRFHRRVYEQVLAQSQTGVPFDLSLCGGEFTPAEMGRIVELQNRPFSKENAVAEWKDCIRVILEEKEKDNAPAPADMDTEQWARNIQKITQRKEKPHG